MQFVFQAMSSVKEGEDAYTKIGEALDHIDKRQLTSDPRVSVIRSPEQVNGSLGHHNHFVSGTCDPQPTNNASGTKLQDVSDKNEAQIPSELITSCVATLLMIQVTEVSLSLSLKNNSPVMLLENNWKWKYFVSIE